MASPAQIDELLDWIVACQGQGDGQPNTTEKRVFDYLNHALFSRTSDPYRVLGLTPTCDAEAIRTRYKRLLQVFHPDRHSENQQWFTSCTEEINRAHTYLKRHHGRPGAGEVPFVRVTPQPMRTGFVSKQKPPETASSPVSVYAQRTRMRRRLNAMLGDPGTLQKKVYAVLLIVPLVMLGVVYMNNPVLVGGHGPAEKAGPEPTHQPVEEVTSSPPSTTSDRMTLTMNDAAPIDFQVPSEPTGAEVSTEVKSQLAVGGGPIHREDASTEPEPGETQQVVDQNARRPESNAEDPGDVPATANIEPFPIQETVVAMAGDSLIEPAPTEGGQVQTADQDQTDLSAAKTADLIETADRAEVQLPDQEARTKQEGEPSVPEVVRGENTIVAKVEPQLDESASPIAIAAEGPPVAEMPVEELYQEPDVEPVDTEMHSVLAQEPVGADVAQESIQATGGAMAEKLSTSTEDSETEQATTDPSPERIEDNEPAEPVGVPVETVAETEISANEGPVDTTENDDKKSDSAAQNDALEPEPKSNQVSTVVMQTATDMETGPPLKTVISETVGAPHQVTAPSDDQSNPDGSTEDAEQLKEGGEAVAAGTPTVQRERDILAVRALLREYQYAYMLADIGRLMALFHPDATVEGMGDQPGVEQAYARMFRLTEDRTLILGEVDIEVFTDREYRATATYTEERRWIFPKGKVTRESGPFEVHLRFVDGEPVISWLNEQQK